MAAKANVIGIIVQPGGTVLVGRESTVADDGVAGINLRGFVSASFVQTANDSSANYHANNSGSNVSSSRESHSRTTGFNAGNYNLQIYNGCIDTAGVIKFIIAHSAADKKVMLADDGLSDVSFDTGTTSILDSTLSTPSAITIGKNGSAANTVVDVSSSNHTIRCGQGMNFYNGGTLLARASTLYLGTSSSSPYAGENSSRWGINLSVGKIGGASTSAAPTGTWYVSSIRSTISSNTLRFTTGTCTITGKNTSANRFFEITDGNVYHSNGTLTIDSGVSAEMQWDAASTDQDNGPYNFIINDASCTARIRTALEVLNDMTVTAGTFNTHSNDGGADKNLTVTGYCDVTGTLTLNDSVVSVAALRCNSGAAVTQGSSGTLALATGSNFGGTEGSAYSLRNLDGTSDINLGGTTTVTGGSYFEPRTATVYASVLNNIVWNSGQYWVGEIKIGGTLVVNASKHMQPYGGSKNLTVDGDVTLAGQLSAHPNGHSDLKTMTFGSLTIDSGGQYNAPDSGTTTITGEVAATDYSWKNDGGTFTHNNGKVLLTEDSDCKVKENTFYDFELNLNSATTDCVFEDTSGNTLTFLGDLTLTRGRFDDDANGDEYIVHGNTIIESNAKFGKATNWHTGDITHHGLVVLNGGTYYRSDAGGTVKMGGIRNIGGSIL